MSFLKDPLVHFLAIGLVLFAVYDLRTPDPEPANEITITAGQLENMKQLFQRTWRRPPTEAETEKLIEARIREEVLAREAVELGLAENDAIVRARLVQKFEFLTDSLAEGAEPSAEDLQTQMDTDPERYRRLAVLSFEQVFFRGSGGAADGARIAKALGDLKAGVDPQTVGDGIDLPAIINGAVMDRIDRAFGKDFAAGVAQGPEGEWAGPVVSAYGQHLVRLIDMRPAAIPPVDEIRDQLARDWREARQNEVRDKVYAELRAKYRIEIENGAERETAAAAAAK